jgi:hypothetical protein
VDTRIINQNELDILFFEEFSQNQVHHITKILLILAQYALLSTDMLMQLYLKNCDEKMGLSFLKRAVKEKLIIEFKENLETSEEKCQYYYALKSSTVFYLQQNRIPCIKMPFVAGYEEKSRLLTFNSYAIQRNFTLNQQIPLDLNLRFFVTNQKVICYFRDYIDPEKIRGQLQKCEDKGEIKFEEILMPLLEIGQYTRAIHPKDVD